MNDNQNINSELLQQYNYDLEAYKQNLKCHFADRKEVQPTGRRAPEGLQRPKKPLRRSLEIPADTSSADFVLRLKGNEPYPSLLMSEELLTTISANRTKHGDFVHYILNCYHEEPIHRGRKNDDEDTIVHRPRLAMLLSGTMGAVRQFIPAVEDGLASRMLFVELPFALPWIDELSDAEAHRFNSTLRETADVATQFYEALRRFDSSHTKVTLALSEHQSRYINRVMARLPSEFTRADAVRVGEEFGVAVRTVDRNLFIWQKTNVIEQTGRGQFCRIDK